MFLSNPLAPKQLLSFIFQSADTAAEVQRQPPHSTSEKTESESQVLNSKRAFFPLTATASDWEGITQASVCKPHLLSGER